MMIRQFILLLMGIAFAAAEPLPIDPMWKTESFRKSFTAAYGIDSRTEPNLTLEERGTLDAVSKKMAAGDRAAAISTLANSPLLAQSAAMLFNLGGFLFEQGKAEEAIKNFRAALKLKPNFRDANRNLAVCLVQQGNYKNAETHLRRALELGSQDGLTFGLLGYCLTQSERPQDALQAYRMAVLTMPNELQWKLGEATALMDLDHLTESATIYEQVLNLAPERVGIWVNLADVKLRQGKNLMAIVDLEVAHRLGGLDSAATLSLGHLYLNESLPDRAMSYYREGLRASSPPKLSKAAEAVEYLLQYQRWEDLQKLVDEIKSIAFYKEQIVTEPNQALRLERVEAMIEIKVGSPDSGAKGLESILKKNPLDGLALLILSEHYQLEDDIDKALMLLERASSVPEHAAEAERRRGEILVGREDYQAALKALRKAQELEPEKGLLEYIGSIERLSKLYERQ